jgi:hypothetical protein
MLYIFENITKATELTSYMLKNNYFIFNVVFMYI